MQAQATFRFYEELNDFLAPQFRKRSFVYSFKGHPSIKDVIEALGVPHCDCGPASGASLLKNSRVTYGHFIRNASHQEQIKELINYYDLTSSLQPFNRCLVCNRALISVEKNKIAEKLPPKTQKYFEEFMQCPDCQKIYWPGSHYEKLKKYVTRLGVL